MQEFKENRLLKWSPQISKALSTAGLLIESLKTNDNISRKRLLIYGEPLTGTSSVAVHLAKETGFTFIRMCSMRNMKFDPKKGIAIRIEDLQSFKINRQHFIFAIDHDVKALYGRHDDDLQEFKENQLLAKMDGVEQLNNILIIGMTNRRDMIDEALLRPGRMGVQIEVPLPSQHGRLQIFEIHTKKLREKNILADDIDLKELAALTKNYSGAEIEAVVMAALANAQDEKFDPKKGIDYSSIGPRFSIFLVNNLIGMINCFVPKNKKMLIIGTTKHLSAMHELEFFSAFDKNCIKIPEIKTPSEIISVLADQDLYSDSDLQQIDNHLQMGDCSDLAIGIKNLMENCKDLKSVDPARRVDELLMKLKSSSEFQF